MIEVSFQGTAFSVRGWPSISNADCKANKVQIRSSAQQLERPTKHPLKWQLVLLYLAFLSCCKALSPLEFLAETTRKAFWSSKATEMNSGPRMISCRGQCLKRNDRKQNNL